MKKWQAAESIRNELGDWIIRPGMLEDAVIRMVPLVLPDVVPTRILLAVPQIPPAYFCIPSFESWHRHFLGQVRQYAMHLEALYDCEVPVLITEHQYTVLSNVMSWFQRLLIVSFRGFTGFKRVDRRHVKMTEACGQM